MWMSIGMPAPRQLAESAPQYVRRRFARQPEQAQGTLPPGILASLRGSGGVATALPAMKKFGRLERRGGAPGVLPHDAKAEPSPREPEQTLQLLETLLPRRARRDGWLVAAARLDVRDQTVAQINDVLARPVSCHLVNP